jgi:hypothetical protein
MIVLTNLSVLVKNRNPVGSTRLKSDRRAALGPPREHCEQNPLGSKSPTLEHPQVPGGVSLVTFSFLDEQLYYDNPCGTSTSQERVILTARGQWRDT